MSNLHAPVPDSTLIEYPADTGTNPIPPLARRRREPKRRAVCVYDGQEGALTREDGATYFLTPHARLSAILGAVTANVEQLPAVLYLCGGTATDEAPEPSWYREPVSEGWHVELRWDVPAKRTAVYTMGRTIRIDVRHACAWFGDTPAAWLPLTFLEHYDELEASLGAVFGSDGVDPVLYGSPAQTGLDLIDRSLPFGREYPALPAALREILHRNSPQARRELYPAAAAGPTIPGFWYMDARFAYAGCVRRLPCWLQEHRVYPHATGEYVPFVPAWYQVAYQVPREWAHVGLLPEKVSDKDPESGWRWPRDGGTWHFGWVSGEELGLALEHGWRCKIHERVLFADPKTTPGADPLETWQKRMVQLWAAAGAGVGPEDRPALRAAYRNLTLHPIGSFHRSHSYATHFVPYGGDLPRGAGPTARAEVVEGGLMFRIPVDVPRAMLRYEHPEWSAAVWARQRVRLTRAMLRQDPSTLLGCNTDAFYATADPGWEDDGKVGTFRRKGHAITAERTTPTSWRELLALRDECERGEV